MNLILTLVYHFLKRLTKIVLGIFFSKATIINKDFAKFENATILVSNHPNTLFDPLNTALHVDKMVHFLTNAGLFEIPVLGFLLSKFYCIPIERQKDVNGRSVSNQESFSRCDDFLTDGGCLYIAPESTSVMEQHLRKLKTGTARIALRAEAKNNFQLGLTILPVGLTYSAPPNFRSEVLVNIGEPIKAADYQSLFEVDNFNAARKLTEDLQKALGNLIYNTRDDDEELFIKKIETIINNENPADAKTQFFRAKEFIACTRKLKERNPKDYQQLSQNLDFYFTEMESLRINDEAIAASQRRSNPLKNIFFLILGFPFFIYGFLNNFLAFYTPALLAKKLNLYIGYTSTVKAMTGILSLPIFYGLQICLFQFAFNNSTLTAFYALSLLPTGWITWEYLVFAKQYFKNYKALLISKKGDDRILNLGKTRKNLLESLAAISSVAKP